MSYIKLSIDTTEEYFEIFTAELAAVGFDIFEEIDKKLHSYIPSQDYDEQAVSEIFERYKALVEVSFEKAEIEKQNWNEEWEKNYHPIEVDKQCRIRAAFHEADSSFDHEIVITPKMSFGTGHHATTYCMIKLELDCDFKSKKVLDVGAGTGILAIMAAKLGAQHIEATDIDEWCIENSQENFELNNLPNTQVHLGNIDEVELRYPKYEIILANINKNVLLDQISSYNELLDVDGVLFLSGFYEKDIVDIEAEALKHKLTISSTLTKDNWAAIKLTRA